MHTKRPHKLAEQITDREVTQILEQRFSYKPASASLSLSGFPCMSSNSHYKQTITLSFATVNIHPKKRTNFETV